MTSSRQTITDAARRSRSLSRVRLATAACVMAVFVATPVLYAERLSDKDVKALLERIDQERDRFEDQLDGNLKRSILRGPGGETNVARFLDDLQENVDKMKSRFNESYAAGAEVTTVLRQGSAIQRHMAQRPPNFDGASEWNRLSASLGELAAAYGATMPLPEGQQAIRMNDAEVAKAADDLARGADAFKKQLDSSLKKDATIDKTTRAASVGEADGLKEDAKRLKSAVGDGRPASGEAQAVLARAAKIRGQAAGRTLSPPALTALGALDGHLDKISQAFNITRPQS